MTGITVGFDAIGANERDLPAGAQVAGYDTGTGIVPWTAAQFAAHPGAIHIDQDPGARDATSDVLDVESGAATFADCPGWVKRAEASFNAGTRPGQRWPAIYASASNLTSVCDSLIAGGVTSGAGLWVANWSVSEAQAIADVQNAGGPFPIIGFQFRSGAAYDTDIWSSAWLANVSGKAGAYRHATDGRTSLGTLAASRNMGVFPWLAEQDRLNARDAGNLTASAVPPANQHWWSVSP